ncbi:MATE family efflux transporter [Kocuria oceani]|uniref:MATE family efflux transporter n=1 Tax=Kocuria oceani TaxID=988827 RepID=UPI004035F37C
MTTTARPRGLNRQILALAVPAFGALVAEPLFLLADSAIVGHLGTPQLAGVGVAAALVQTVVGLMVFLAYSTTPAVARHLGAGRLPEAVAVGRDGLWVAAGLGVLLSAAGWVLGRPLLERMGARGEVLEHAVAYLHWSLPGLTGMLLVLAATGVLRGLQDTRTPLLIAGIGAAANAVLNLALVHGAGLGVAGAAIGTSAVQWAMALAYLRIVHRLARRHGVGPGTSWARLRSHLAVGSWLMLRTVSLRVAILATVLVVTAQGAQNLAAHQLVMTVFSFLAFALDALAIAAQALLGRDMGARDLAEPAERQAIRDLMRRLVLWGLGFGVVTGLAVAVLGTRLGFLLSPDPAVQALFAAALLVVAAGQPLAAYVFVLDGVLIGAGDARYLAVAGVLNLAVYAPLLALVADSGGSGTGGLVWLWIAYAGGYLGARALTLGLRARGDAWLLRNAR